MKAEDADRVPMWFKSEKILHVYVIFSGQQIFMSGINLGKLSEPKVFIGLKAFLLDIQTEVFQNLPSANCKHVAPNLHNVMEAHKSYEIWSEL